MNHQGINPLSVIIYCVGHTIGPGEISLGVFEQKVFNITSSMGLGNVSLCAEVDSVVE